MELAGPLLIVPCTRATVPLFAPMRKKPRLVVRRKSPVPGSTSSALTYGGFLEKSTSRSERFAGPLAARSPSPPPHPASSSKIHATAMRARMRA